MSQTTTAGGAPVIDIGHALDQGPFTALQKGVIFLCAMAIVLDGFDGQLIGFAIPMIIKEWGITRAAFAPAVASGLIGMAVGMAMAGSIADRIGRRLVLAFSVLLFGAATVAIGFSPDVETIIALRFVAGLGIGGALPSCSTMTAEYAPARSRTMAVTISIVCFPLGGMLAGLFAGWVLPTYGWRALFWIGGAIPMAFSLVLFAFLPESPRFLASQRQRWQELVKLLNRLERPTPANAEFTDSLEAAASANAKQAVGMKGLFTSDYARDTIGLWLAFFMVVLSLYSAYSWLPTMLTSEGLPVSLASQGLTAYNVGGVVGSLLCALIVNRFGSRIPMIIMALLAGIVAIAMMGIDTKQDTQMLITGFGIHGLFVSASQVLLYALCAYVYPTSIRATGTAMALAVGRGGGIVSAFIGAAVITAAGANGFLTLLAVGMFGSAFALMLIKRHIPPVSGRITKV